MSIAPSAPRTPSPEVNAARAGTRRSSSRRAPASAFEGLVAAAFDAGAAFLRSTRERASTAGVRDAAWRGDRDPAPAPRAPDATARPESKDHTPSETAATAHTSAGDAHQPSSATGVDVADAPVAATSVTPATISPAQAALLLEQAAPPSAPAAPAPQEATAPPSPVTLTPLARGPEQLTLRIEGEDGAIGHLRVAIRGQSVRATLVTPDADAAERMDLRLSELTRALAARGFTDAHVSVVGTHAADADTHARFEDHAGAETDRRALPDRREGGGRREDSRRQMLRALRDAA